MITLNNRLPATEVSHKSFLKINPVNIFEIIYIYDDIDKLHGFELTGREKKINT